jgi:hypothetical protein
MAKKNKAKPVQEIKKAPEPVAAPQAQNSKFKILVFDFPLPGFLSRLYDFKIQAIIIGALAFILYFNSFFNEYAHDDGIVIVKNEYVQEGFAGIPKILTRDAYDSYYRQLNTTNQLSGGRYRPLSIVTFAIEQQFFGAVAEDNVDSILRQNISFGVRGKQQQRLVHQMHIRHVFNVLWYMLSVIVLLYFFRYVVFKNAPVMALTAALIFTIHPIHTEVVANVKSRDEIMSLLFMCMTFIFEFKYRELKKPWLLIAALVSYFLAFLSKEYAITMVVLLPLALYIFNGYSIKKSLIAFIPYLAVIGVYMALRFHIVAPMSENSDTEVLNNPYVFASVGEKLATEISTSLNYLKLLIFPHPLSADYSYDSIPYKDFLNPVVWLSLIAHCGLVVAMVALFKKRSLLCFAIAFYLLHLILVCNIFFDIGATMGERLIYHSSVGFAIAAAYFIVKAAGKIKPVAVAQKSLAAFLLIIIVLSGFKTIQRNADWKNDNVLFAADLKTVPNSVLVLGNVAASYITLADDQKNEKDKDEILYKSIELLNHAITIHPKFVAGFINRGISWYKLGVMDKAKANLDSARMLYPNYPTLPGIYKLIGNDYMKKGWEKYGKFGKYPQAIEEFKKGIAIDSTNAELWYNLGGAYFSNKQYPEAIEAWKISLRIDPTNMKAQQGYHAAIETLKMNSQPPKN